MTSQVTRVTMIKIPNPSHIPLAIEGFRTFASTQEKDGKPYILSMEAGPAEGSVKEQGYSFVTKSVFKSLEDMEYYSTECKGHQVYKDFLKKNAPVEGLMSVYFMAEASFTI